MIQKLEQYVIGANYGCGGASFSEVIDKVNEVIDYINSLPEEKPSEDLQEAAENYIAPIENDEGLDYINFNGRDIKESFIAGAEWQRKQDEHLIWRVAEKNFEGGKEAMKEQMTRAAVEGKAEELYNDGESQCTVGVGTYFKPGDEVYVIKKD